jgi:triacylglycerol lipase
MLAAALRFFLLVELAAYVATAMNVFNLPAVSAVLAALAVLLGWRVGIVGTTYAFAVAYHSPAPKLGLLRAIGMVLAEYLAFLKLFLVIQPFERLWMGADRLPQGRRVVLLIHGYGCNRGAWWWLRRRLEDAGYAVATLNLEPPYIAIEHYLAALDARIEAACAEAGVRQVTLIGHSMGGLVARAYLEQKGCGRVEQLITMATPHAGSVLSRIGMGANSRQMEFNSPWIKALWQQRPELPMVSLRTSHDNFVMPQDSQRFPGARDVELPALGHLALLFSPRAAEALLEGLGR